MKGRYMKTPVRSIEEVLKVDSPVVELSAQELKAADGAVNWYLKTYLLPFNSVKKLDKETFDLLRNRVINVALEYYKDIQVSDALKKVCSTYYMQGAGYTNLIHATSDEERAIIKVCQTGNDRAFTYLFLLMGHKVTTYIYENHSEGFKSVDTEDIANSLLIGFYEMCCSYDLSKYKKGGISNRYVAFYFKDICLKLMGENDILSYPVSARRRINKIHKELNETSNYDGKTSISSDEIRNKTQARYSELSAYYALNDTVSLDSLQGKKIAGNLLDPFSDFTDENIERYRESDEYYKISQVMDLTEEEIAELVNALVRYIEENLISTRGKVKKLSRRSIMAFCSTQRKELTNPVVKKFLTEFAYYHTGQHVFFA